MESAIFNILVTIINIANTFLISKIQRNIFDSYMEFEKKITIVTLQEKKLIYETFWKELDNLTVITKDVQKLKDNYTKKLVEIDVLVNKIDSTL